jgi:hypothetical protein
MMQDNPVLRARGFAAAAAAAAAGTPPPPPLFPAHNRPPLAVCVTAAPVGNMYGLSHLDAPSVLSRSQAVFLEQLALARDQMMAQARRCRAGKGKEEQQQEVGKINLRDSCKVPWR